MSEYALLADRVSRKRATIRLRLNTRKGERFSKIAMFILKSNEEARNRQLTSFAKFFLG
jgi:hypothetical protein